MNYSILCLPTKVEKCVADYLLVNKDVKTKIFAEKIGEEWIVKRGVTTGELFTDFLIDKEVMLTSMNKNYRKICSKVLNKYLSEKYNEKYNEGYFNKIKNYIYWWNEIDENTLNIRELFTENKKDYLIVSEKYQKKLEDQSICLTSFLLKHFGFDGHYFEEKVPEIIRNGEDKIKDNFKISRENEFYAFRAEFMGDYNEIVNHEFKEGQIEELNKCIEILNIKKCYHHVNILDALYNRFDPTQFYYKKLPKFEGTFEIKENDGILCAICRDNIEEGQLAQLTPCGHIYHVNCFWTWYKDHHDCVICRNKFDIKFIGFLDPPTETNEASSNNN